MRKVAKLTIRGRKAEHWNITPSRRMGRGLLAAFQEASDRLKQTYNQEIVEPANRDATWHLVLVRERPEDGPVKVEFENAHPSRCCRAFRR